MFSHTAQFSHTLTPCPVPVTSRTHSGRSHCEAQILTVQAPRVTLMSSSAMSPWSPDTEPSKTR